MDNLLIFAVTETGTREVFIHITNLVKFVKERII